MSTCSTAGINLRAGRHAPIADFAASFGQQTELAFRGNPRKKIWATLDVIAEPRQLRDGESFEGADHLGDAQQGAGHHVLVFVRRRDDPHRAQQDGHEGVLMSRAEEAAEQLEAVERRLPVDGLLRRRRRRLIRRVPARCAHNGEEVPDEL